MSADASNTIPAAASPTWTRRAAALDRAIDQALADQRIVGGVVLVSQDGQPVYQRAAGLADRETGQPVRIDTLFRYSSLTKPIVSAAALALVAQGKLALDQPVHRVLPYFRPRLPDGATPDITLHHLLTHTAGLTYSFWEAQDSAYHQLGVADGLGPSGALTLDQNIRRLAQVPLAFAPGSNWRYSLAIDVVGALIEQVTGETLPQAVARLVTAPLGLRDTAFHVVDRERLATAYADSKPEPVKMGEPHQIPFGAGPLTYSPARAFDPQAFPSGGGGMVGSAPDMLRFLETIRGGGNPILPVELVAQMLRNQTGGLFLDATGPGKSFGYGGAVVTDPSAAQTPQSAGSWYWGGVYGLSWFVDPARKLTVVTATNTGIEGMIGQLTIDIRNAVYS
jgi:CubicO group peptidase (beta-lactamase class C family)